MAVALPLAGGTASAETVKTHDKDVVFDAQHECTGENVSGDTTVKMTITTTENDDGTTTVHAPEDARAAAGGLPLSGSVHVQRG